MKKRKESHNHIYSTRDTSKTFFLSEIYLQTLADQNGTTTDKIRNAPEKHVLVDKDDQTFTERLHQESQGGWFSDINNVLRQWISFFGNSQPFNTPEKKSPEAERLLGNESTTSTPRPSKIKVA